MKQAGLKRESHRDREAARETIGVARVHEKYKRGHVCERKRAWRSGEVTPGAGAGAGRCTAGERGYLF